MNQSSPNETLAPKAQEMKPLSRIASGVSVLIDAPIFLAAIIKLAGTVSKHSIYHSGMRTLDARGNLADDYKPEPSIGEDCKALFARCKSGELLGFYTPETLACVASRLAELGVKNASERIIGVIESNLRMLEINTEDFRAALELSDRPRKAEPVEAMPVVNPPPVKAMSEFERAARAKYSSTSAASLPAPKKEAQEEEGKRPPLAISAALAYCAFRRSTESPIAIATSRADFYFVSDIVYKPMSDRLLVASQQRPPQMLAKLCAAADFTQGNDAGLLTPTSEDIKKRRRRARSKKNFDEGARRREKKAGR